MARQEKEQIIVRYLMRDRFTKRPVVEFNDQPSAVAALHSLAPIRRDKYELIPQVIARRIKAGGVKNAQKKG